MEENHSDMLAQSGNNVLPTYEVHCDKCFHPGYMIPGKRDAEGYTHYRCSVCGYCYRHKWLQPVCVSAKAEALENIGVELVDIVQARLEEQVHVLQEQVRHLNELSDHTFEKAITTIMGENTPLSRRCPGHPSDD